jgi:hypothetical protein
MRPGPLERRVGRRLGLAAVKVAGQFPSLRYGRALFTVR